MQPLSAVYTRMNSLLTEMGTVSQQFGREISMLQDKLKNLGISWEGAAYDEYSRALLEDLMIMEMTAANIRLMYGLLYRGLTGYQQTEKQVNDLIGGMK